MCVRAVCGVDNFDIEHTSARGYNRLIRVTEAAAETPADIGKSA